MGGGVAYGGVDPGVDHRQAPRIEDENVLDALREVEAHAQLEVFGFVTWAQHLDDGFRDQCDRLVELVRFSAEDGDVGALERSVWKLDVDIGDMNAAACPSRLPDGRADAVHRALMAIGRGGLPNGEPPHDLEPNPELFRPDELRVHPGTLIAASPIVSGDRSPWSEARRHGHGAPLLRSVLALAVDRRDRIGCVGAVSAVEPARRALSPPRR